MSKLLLLLLIPTMVLADAPDGYYDSAIGLTGVELVDSIHSIVDSHTVLKYTTGTNTDWLDGKDIDVWEALVYTDSACLVDKPNCGDVRLLYLGEARHLSKANRGKSKNDSWDREHVRKNSCISEYLHVQHKSLFVRVT